MSRFAAILSGGVGERFWPASTPERPKQLLPLLGRRTMLRETLERLVPLIPGERTFIVTSADLADAMARECPELPRENVIGEPRRRNTAAAVGVAAWAVLARGGDEAALAILPADHAVRDTEDFRAALSQAFAVAEAESLIVTLGIAPDRAETGYGWITRGVPLAGSASVPAGLAPPGGAFRIAAFHEKPDATRAAELLASGTSYWNAGIFIARARTILDEIRRQAPALGELLDRLPPEGPGPGRPAETSTAFAELYERAPAISFDHAVMERTDAGAMVPADIGWDDVGSWEAMARLRATDPQGNVVHGEGRLAAARDNIVFADGGRITVIGAENLLVVRAGSEILVCAREKLPQIREILRELNGHER